MSPTDLPRPDRSLASGGASGMADRADPAGRDRADLAGRDRAGGSGRAADRARAPAELFDELRQRLDRLAGNHPSAWREPPARERSWGREVPAAWRSPDDAGQGADPRAEPGAARTWPGGPASRAGALRPPDGRSARDGDPPDPGIRSDAGADVGADRWSGTGAAWRAGGDGRPGAGEGTGGDGWPGRDGRGGDDQRQAGRERQAADGGRAGGGAPDYMSTAGPHWQGGDLASDGNGWLNADRQRPAELRRPWFMSGDQRTPWFAAELDPD